MTGRVIDMPKLADRSRGTSHYAPFHDNTFVAIRLKSPVATTTRSKSDSIRNPTDAIEWSSCRGEASHV